MEVIRLAIVVWVTMGVITAAAIGLSLFGGLHYERRNIPEPPWLDSVAVGGLLVGLIIGVVVIPAVVLGTVFASTH